MHESIHGERTASELQDRVTELIEQQTAISEVLRAIANSPQDLQPIFDTIVANATRLCRAELGSLTLFKGNDYRVVSLRAAPVPYYAGWDQGRVFPVLPSSPRARLVESRSPVHVADMAAEPAYREFSRAKSFGARTLLLVPMLKEDQLIGAIGIARTQVRPFTDAQIDLITDFAAQATVALESTRRERQYREIKSELAHANRVATIGQLTASITHEIKQPIATARNRTLRFGRFELSGSKRMLRRDGVALPLGSRAFDILIYLAERPGEVIGKKELIDHIWPNVIVEEGSLRVHVAGIRKALWDGQFGNRYIANVRGRGYTFIGSVVRIEDSTENTAT